MATLLQLADNPGEATGYGPIAPAITRLLAGAAAGHPATRWQLTVTSPEGQALATGSSRRSGRAIPAASWTVTVHPSTTGDCDHHNQEPGYRPSPTLARLIRTRNTTCSFPGAAAPPAALTWTTQCRMRTAAVPVNVISHQHASDNYTPLLASSDCH